ncbi:TonB-dependent receptor [Hymenobacter arcticus]
MTYSYFLPFILLITLPATAQTGAALATASPADTVRGAFRGTLPDSLAEVPTPGGTFRLQGPEQPIRPFLTIQDQLRMVAGVQVTPYDGSPGSGSVVRIRGASVALGQAQPLYVIDGLPALNDELTVGQAPGMTAPLPPFLPPSSSSPSPSTIAEQHAEAGANPLQLLPPESIESVEILAGPAAVARYGPLGANGVVSIRTRRGQEGRPLRVRYAAYAGVQQVRQRYDLLPAGEYAALVNEAMRNDNSPAPYPNTNLGAGTDWQAETYRVAGLQQHQVSLDGSHANTTYLLSADYRQQRGVLRGSDLTRFGLRLALDQRVGTHLRLHGTAALGQTDQRLPYTQGDRGSTLAALLAPPTQPVRTDQGNYSGYGSFTGQYDSRNNFTNPLAINDYTYRSPRTRRLLTQLAADYEPLPHLTVQAAANFQRTLLDAESSAPPFYTYQAPASSQTYATQIYHTSQWAAQLAVRYQRQLGARHEVGAEVNYQYQAADLVSRTDYYFSNKPAPGTGTSYSSGFYQLGPGETRLHRPWASLHYTFDSTLTVQAGLSYGHYRGDSGTQYYPNAQLSWQARPGRADLRLWLGAARTGVPLLGYGPFGPTPLIGGGAYPDYRYQSPLHTDQVEAGMHLGQRGGHLTGQLVAYQRTSYHALISNALAVPDFVNNGVPITGFDEATIRNRGLELTLTARWQWGRLQGATSLAASYNHNRLQENSPINANSTPQSLGPVYDNQPTGAFYGFQQDGLNANGTLRFRTQSSGGQTLLTQAIIGSGIPAQLASMSQQLRLGRLGLDAQVDGMFGYQVLNYQRDLLDTPTGYTNNATTVRDRWTPTHQNTAIPGAGYSGNFNSTYGTPLTDRLLENGNHVRLSSLTLTYRLRQTATQDLSLWIGGQNLLVLTGYRGYDPNVSSGGPTPLLAGRDYGAVPVPRTWLLGVRASI